MFSRVGVEWCVINNAPYGLWVFGVGVEWCVMNNAPYGLWVFGVGVEWCVMNNAPYGGVFLGWEKMVRNELGGGNGLRRDVGWVTRNPRGFPGFGINRCVTSYAPYGALSNNDIGVEQ